MTHYYAKPLQPLHYPLIFAAVCAAECYARLDGGGCQITSVSTLVRPPPVYVVIVTPIDKVTKAFYTTKLSIFGTRVRTNESMRKKLHLKVMGNIRAIWKQTYNNKSSLNSVG